MQGKSDGEVKVFKNNGIPQAFMWKAAERKWDLVGNLVDPNEQPGAGDTNIGMAAATKVYPGDQMFPAGEYDHIFDVELGDGIMRKLPFNNGGN
mmetsp:Transcript_37553/g.57529  ORF Transcript_37553/g.57529 Transcript_37553/m.57529 type:complete len:94 (+) Transcript_37553:1061-1342(+)